MIEIEDFEWQDIRQYRQFFEYLCNNYDVTYETPKQMVDILKVIICLSRGCHFFSCMCSDMIGCPQPSTRSINTSTINYTALIWSHFKYSLRTLSISPSTTTAGPSSTSTQLYSSEHKRTYSDCKCCLSTNYQSNN